MKFKKILTVLLIVGFFFGALIYADDWIQVQRQRDISILGTISFLTEKPIVKNLEVFLNELDRYQILDDPDDAMVVNGIVAEYIKIFKRMSAKEIDSFVRINEKSDYGYWVRTNSEIQNFMLFDWLMGLFPAELNDINPSFYQNSLTEINYKLIRLRSYANNPNTMVLGIGEVSVARKLKYWLSTGSYKLENFLKKIGFLSDYDPNNIKIRQARALIKSRIEKMYNDAEKGRVGYSLTEKEKTRLLKRMFVPVYVENFPFNYVYLAGALGPATYSERVFIKYGDLDEGLKLIVVNTFELNKISIAKKKVEELAAKIIIHGYKQGTKEWFRVNGWYSDGVKLLPYYKVRQYLLE